MTYSLLITQQFNSAKSGLNTVGYTLLNADLTVRTARATSGVLELHIGSGQYGALIPFPDGFQGYIKWDTGDSFTEIQVVASNTGVSPPWYQGSSITSILANTQGSAFQVAVSASLNAVDITKSMIDKTFAYAADHIHYDDTTGIVTIYDPTGSTIVTQFQDTYNANGHLIDRTVLQ